MKFITLTPNAMILPLEKQVCSLDLARRLKELGAPQESWYMWEGIAHDVNESGIIVFKYGLKKARDNGNPLRYAAYTVAELGELLPSKIDGNFIETSKCLDSSGYNCCAGYLDSTKSSVSFCERTEADARAKMLIYLLESGLLNRESVK